MRSNWIEHKGKKILYQDFSKNFFNSAAVASNIDFFIQLRAINTQTSARIKCTPAAASAIQIQEMCSA